MSTLGRLAESGVLVMSLAACEGTNPVAAALQEDRELKDVVADMGADVRDVMVTPMMDMNGGGADTATGRSDMAVGRPDASMGTPDTSVVGQDGAMVSPDAAIIMPDASAVMPDAAEPDARVIPREICGDGEDNDQNGAADCDDRACAQSPAVEVDFGQDGTVLTMFGQVPVEVNGTETRSLSCEAYNLGVPFDALLSGRENAVETQIFVRSYIAGVGVGIWVFDNNEPVQFHNGGQMPLGEPSIGIASGGYGPNNQAYEVFFPYAP